MRSKMNRLLFVLIITGFSITSAYSQKFGVKTNLLYDAITTMNLGVEFGMGKKWTMDVSASVNPWTFSNNKKWKIMFLQPEAKYWFCENFNGHFIGFHAHGGEFNIGGIDVPSFKWLGKDLGQLKDHRYEGWFVGAGLTYGYSWILSTRWNLEASIGIGYSYIKYDRYQCPSCGEWLNDGHYHYVGPTKAALSLIYLFK